MSRKACFISIIALFCGMLAACSPAPEVDIAYDVDSLRFSGERALTLETEFVTQFPYRDSGQPNNQLAAEWLEQQFTYLGLECYIDEWEVIN